MNPFAPTDYFHRPISPQLKWLTLGIILLIAQGYLFFTDNPPSQPPAWMTWLDQLLAPLPGVSAPSEPGFDLIVHFSGFALITTTLLLARLRPLFLFFTLTAYAGLTEIIQENLLYYRSGSWLDFAADALGISLALLLYLYWRKRVF